MVLRGNILRVLLSLHLAGSPRYPRHDAAGTPGLAAATICPAAARPSGACHFRHGIPFKQPMDKHVAGRQAWAGQACHLCPHCMNKTDHHLPPPSLRTSPAHHKTFPTPPFLLPGITRHGWEEDSNLYGHAIIQTCICGSCRHGRQRRKEGGREEGGLSKQQSNM